ncbi:aldehyde dehydrogenase family protein [Candidatus Mycoplasma haematominutum]|uniref:NADP-dependent glyceraldehyde-3-phosphate dehydrogenase n=1 Tax=Candidatus Mycoplasma haematominutum 'Birmingham 1' TaxID=1116213 RepID=G8C2J0_9MOLU|nr:aldehyde dehydrogenase family protein [Candidatus Mycoplasma haematominutum]CCE66538.1 NADP-dependent glyceraldehyde-3-phosphate dehydrogenase [Candidatus Mycoplasma haematominutum 'Birmingham 1']
MFKASAFIHGEPVDSSNLPIKELYSAANRELIGTIPLLDNHHQKKLFDSSIEGYKKWSQVSSEVREKFLFLFASKLKEHQRWLTQLIQLESGKSEGEAESEILRSIEYITESIHVYNELIKTPREYSSEKYPLIPDDLQAVYVRAPLGVVLSITPFNYPLNTLITKITPAILMGNSVIQKSSMNGALTGWLVCKIFNELSLEGFMITPGVLNYYTGSGWELQKYIENYKPEISALSFTGSNRAGIAISSALPGIPQSLELSALNVALILKDANVDNAIPEILKGAFSLSGQRCTSLQLVCVPQTLLNIFEEKIITELHKFSVSKTPIVDSNTIFQIKEAYEEAISKGAKLLTAPINWNNIKQPLLDNVVFSRVSFEMKLAREELFGPILGIVSYINLEETVEKINEIGFGLQSSVFSENFDKAVEISSKIDVGRININMAPARSPDYLPFPASRKSGNSEQGIVNALYFFSKFRGIVYKNPSPNTSISRR